MSDSIFLSSIETGIPEAQLLVINNLINDGIRSGIIISKQDALSSIESFKEKIRLNGKFFDFINVKPEVIRSEDLNRYFNSIDSDLKTLYSGLETLSSYERRIKAATKDDFIKTKSSILEVINKIVLYNFLKDNTEYQDAKFINFNSSTNKTGVNPKAEVDIKTKKLKLPASSLNRYSISRFNLDSSSVDFNIFGGGISNKGNDSFSINNTLDSNPNNFWSTLVMCDGRPYHKVLLSHSSEERFIGSGKQKGNTYESNGIVVEVVYNFSKSISINNLRIEPFADYPLYILDIGYKTSSASSQWLPLTGFDPVNYPETLDWIEWNGKPIITNSIRILIEQANFNSNSFQVPKKLAKNNELWEQLLSSRYNELSNIVELDSITEKISFHPNELIRINKELQLNERLKKQETDLSNKKYSEVENISKTVKDIIGEVNEESSELITISKLFYNIGLRSVEFNDINYEGFGYYESEKFESNANILELSLDSEEEHFYLSDGITGEKFKETSIEFEVELSDKTAYPIVPISSLFTDNLGNKCCKIQDEFMTVNRSSYSYTCRFPIPSWINQSLISVQIRKNGQRIPQYTQDQVSAVYPYNYNITLSTIDNKRYITVSFNELTFDIRSTYTISYISDESASIIDLKSILNSDSLSPTESFTETNKDNSVTISYYPYIEYSIINNTGIWNKFGSEYNFIPSSYNYSIGKIGIDNSNSSIIYGTGTFWVDNGVRDLVTGNTLESSGASFKIEGSETLYRISGITSNSGLTLYNSIETGFLNGSALTGLSYTIGKTHYVDGKIYGLSNSTYEPIKVFVNDVKALNKTDYFNREHEAFSSNTYQNEFVQIGKKVFFNKPLSGKIEVDYSYLTKYIKINAILRSHKLYNSKVTPILTSYKLLIKNNKL